MAATSVTGAGGVRLHVEDVGPRGAPAVLLVHGYSQSSLAWRRQLGGDLARRHRVVALDLRGHGRSDKPAEPAAYRSSEVWADDLAAVIDQLGLRRPVLTGWSYGGYVLCDYLRRHGQDAIAGVHFVAAATKMGTPEALGLLGPDFLTLVPATHSDDVATSTAALEMLARLCVATDLTFEELALALGSSVLATPVARRSMFRRTVDNDDVLAALTVPVHFSHGRRDAVVLVAATERSAALVPHATVSYHDGVGHMPFTEDQKRFEADVAALSAR